MTVGEVLKLEEEEIRDKRKEYGDYWDKSADFYKQVKDKDIKTLTQKQKDWLLKIREKLGD